MHLPAPYLADRAAVEDAHALITLHGEEAGFAAAARAEQYRALGKHVHFARWRQIERLITTLSVEDIIDTVHSSLQPQTSPPGTSRQVVDILDPCPRRALAKLVLPIDSATHSPFLIAKDEQFETLIVPLSRPNPHFPPFR